MADVINSVFFKDLNPSIADTHDTAFYDQAARGVRGVAFAFEPHYSLNFNAPVVSSKVRYIKALIDNAIASELNDKFNLLDDGETNLILFHRKKMFEQTQARLLRAKEIINSGGYILNDIMSAKDYTVDRQRFECIFIFNYIVQASIREYLEFQAHYQSHIPPEKIVPLERFYLEILGAPVPSPAFIVQAREIEVKAPFAKPDSFQPEEVVDDAYTVFMTEVAKYKFSELSKVAALPTQQQTRLVRHTVTQGTPYTVAMLSYLGYPEYLKTTYHLNKEDMYRHVSKALDNVAVRTIKGNFLVLNPDSNDDREKYTSYKCTDDVKSFYESLPHK